MKALAKVLAILVLTLLATAIALRVLVFDLVEVRGDDMLPALGKGAWVLVSRKGEPKRGDLILYRGKDNTYHVRRVVALHGERIQINDSRPIVMGKRATHEVTGTVRMADRTFKIVQESMDGRHYDILDDTMRRVTDQEEQVVDGLFVMADNREHSRDSRDGGSVPAENVRGIVVSVLARGAIPTQP
ncbi:MAG: signal peptidase I [Deltaproteobacteria bacterium]|nr:signal peptidase I [Deltaproteobacteria bacterium]